MHWNDISDNLGYLAGGLLITIQLSIFVLLVSTCLGTVLGLLRFSSKKILSWPATLYIESTRSVPLILFIVFVHFGFMPLVLKGTDVSFFLSAVIALTIVFASYIAEIVRGGLKSIERAYIEASKSLGLNYFQMMWYVILPLVMSRMMPALVSQFISIIKETSLASLLGLVELTGAAHIIYARTHHELELLLFIAFVYFSICYTLSILSRRLEPRFQKPVRDYLFNQ